MKSNPTSENAGRMNANHTSNNAGHMNSNLISENAAAAAETFQSLLEMAWVLEEKKIKGWRTEINHLPKGSLYMYTNEGKTYFEHAMDGTRRGITKEEELIYGLARKKYLEIRVNEFEGRFERRGRKLKVKTGRESQRARRLLRKYAEAGLDIRRITFSKEQYLWVTEYYRSNSLYPDEKRYRTLCGVWVRSKSEQAIGNELELSGIPYRYEQMVEVNISWMEDVEERPPRKYKAYFPDFLIMTATGETILWEHLGKVHEGKYRRDNAERISAFRQSGMFREDQLILTFEADMKRSGFLREIIVRRIMPFM